MTASTADLAPEELIEAEPVPPDLARFEMSISGADSAIIAMGYFTPNQERSQAWEAARLLHARLDLLCEGAQLVGRDVRWFEPTRKGEPSCARIVYTIRCAARNPAGVSLDYMRRQTLLEDPFQPIGPQCGERSIAGIIREATDPFLAHVQLTSALEQCANAPPDEMRGQFHLREVNYLHTSVLASPGYVKQVTPPFPSNPTGFLRGAAGREGRRHFVVVNRDIAHDRDNIFIVQTFSDNGAGYCVTLTARQGNSLWRRTIKRDSALKSDHSLRDPNGHSKDVQHYWDQYVDAHTLEHQFAQHLGLPIPSEHPKEASSGVPPMPWSASQTGRVPRTDRDDDDAIARLVEAVERDDAAAANQLLRDGANPWVSLPRQQSAVFRAAQLGRWDLFRQMAELPGRPFVEWPTAYLDAAVSGGDGGIVAAMLAQPHVRTRIDALTPPFLSAAEIEPVLRAKPALADALLVQIARYPSDRLELVELALRHGANPNTKYGQYDTVLGTFASGIGPTSVESVAALLKAGADPNLLGASGRPAWIAVATLRLPTKDDEIERRAATIFGMLVDAGANLNLPDDEGVPGPRRLLFPYFPEPERLNASFVTPELLEMLVQGGLDLNVEWHGKRVLSLVETQAGVDSELAVTLRRLGARH